MAVARMVMLGGYDEAVRLDQEDPVGLVVQWIADDDAQRGRWSCWPCGISPPFSVAGFDVPVS